MKKIEFKGLCSEVEITLNNLRDCRIEESDGAVSVEFGVPGIAVEESSSGALEEEVDGSE